MRHKGSCRKQNEHGMYALFLGSLELLKKFISSERKEDFEMLTTKNTYIQSAYKTLQVITQDDQKRMEYEARQKALRDYNQGMLEAEERGEKRGREEGILGMISAFRDFGHSDADIKTALIKNYNLSGDEAQSLLSETK